MAGPSQPTGVAVRRRGRSAAVLVVGLAVAAGGCADEDGGRLAPTVVATPAATTAQFTPEARSRAVLDRYLHHGDQPGCSAAVGVDGKVVWTGARGVADLATGRELTSDTVFDIGSVSKQFTATAVLLLAGDGKLSVDDVLSEHVPGLPPWAGQVNVAQLMHHTSGIPDYLNLLRGRGISFEQRATHAQALEAIAQAPSLLFAPGDTYNYSNSNYLLLGEIVRRVSGVPLPRFLQERVLVPLDLHMVLDSMGAIAEKANSYDDGGRVLLHPWEHVGAGGLQTTPSDLVRWADNYRTGTVGGRRLLDAQLANPVTLPVVDSPEVRQWALGTEFAYAAGIQISGNGTLVHGGGWAGYRTELQISPDRHTALAVACNTTKVNLAVITADLRRIWM
jgi:CubicO group peptidase (beta-lactamase class C family)